MLCARRNTCTAPSPVSGRLNCQAIQASGAVLWDREARRSEITGARVHRLAVLAGGRDAAPHLREAPGIDVAMESAVTNAFARRNPLERPLGQTMNIGVRFIVPDPTAVKIPGDDVTERCRSRDTWETDSRDA